MVILISNKIVSYLACCRIVIALPKKLFYNTYNFMYYHYQQDSYLAYNNHPMVSHHQYDVHFHGYFTNNKIGTLNTIPWLSYQ